MEKKKNQLPDEGRASQDVSGDEDLEVRGSLVEGQACVSIA